MRLRYNPTKRNGTAVAMELLHQEFMEQGCTMLATDKGSQCIIAFRGEVFVVAEGHPGLFDYHMTDSVMIICPNSEEYIGPAISQDDYDEAEFLINADSSNELRMTWFAPE